MDYSNEQRWILLHVAQEQARDGLWGSALRTLVQFSEELDKQRVGLRTHPIDPIQYAEESQFASKCSAFCAEHIDEQLMRPGAKSLGGVLPDRFALTLSHGDKAISFKVPFEWTPGEGRGVELPATHTNLDAEVLILTQVAEEVLAWAREEQIVRKAVVVLSQLETAGTIDGDMIDWRQKDGQA